MCVYVPGEPVVEAHAGGARALVGARVVVAVVAHVPRVHAAVRARLRLLERHRRRQERVVRAQHLAYGNVAII